MSELGILSTDLDLAESERISRMCWPMRVIATERKEQEGMNVDR